MAGDDLPGCPRGPGLSTWSVAVRAIGNGFNVDSLRPEHFRITSNGVNRTICGFTHVRNPVSIGIVLDISESMTTPGRTPWSHAVVERFVDLSGPQDEYFLAYAGKTARLTVPLTRDIARIRAGLLAPPESKTALLDTLALAVEEIRKAHYAIRALLVISDGGDNRSTLTFSEMRQIWASSPIPVFVVIPPDSEQRWRMVSGEPAERARFTMFATDTGGYVINTLNASRMVTSVEQLASAVRQPYILQFSTTAGQTERSIRIENTDSRAHCRLFYRWPDLQP